MWRATNHTDVVDGDETISMTLLEGLGWTFVAFRYGVRIVVGVHGDQYRIMRFDTDGAPPPPIAAVATLPHDQHITSQ